MRQVFGVLAALAIGWGLCAPAHAQELFPLQAIAGGGGGGGGCTGGDSPYVPAGYHCVPGSSDEFNGTSIDTSKWTFGGRDGCSESGGVAILAATVTGPPNTDANGSTSCGMHSKFPIPDAPMYLEFRRKLTPNVVSLMQFWKTSCDGSNSCTGAEVDIDMGQFNGCNQNNQFPNSSQFGLCSGRFKWDGGGSDGFDDGGASGTVPVDEDQQWHIIGYQILPDPAPNGTMIYKVDGVAVKTLTDMSDNRFIYPSQWLSSPGANGHDTFITDLFCANGNGCGFNMEIDWDYIRVYTPSGLPNGY